jgi:RNA polymerase sigma-70 factor, ECF subfamily
MSVLTPHRSANPGTSSRPRAGNCRSLRQTVSVIGSPQGAGSTGRPHVEGAAQAGQHSGGTGRAHGVPGTAQQPAPGTPDALLVATAHGDRDAFARLYDAVSPAVHGAARAVLRDPDLAAEVTQEVMLEVWRTAPRFDPARGSARTWVITLGHRRAVDRVRAVQAQRDRDQKVMDADHHVPFDVVAEEVEETLERRRVRHCLGSLTDTQRRAVVLAYYGGHSYREVAEQLDAALPTVKSRIRDGLLRLRDCLGVTR